MIFEPNPYSVLIVSPSSKLQESLSTLMPAGEYYPVKTVCSTAEARRCLLHKEFDLVLINSPLPDGPGIGLAEDLCGETEAGVLLLVKAESYEEVTARVQESGVITLCKPGSRQLVAHSLQALCAMRARLRVRGKDQATVEEKIQELRLIDRAKWILMENRRMTEPEAHKALELMAMERRITKRQAAEEVIAGQV